MIPDSSRARKLTNRAWRSVISLQSSFHLPTKFSQPPNLHNLHNLITVQLPRSTRSSSLVTLARPFTASTSSLRITDRSFQYASPRLWNQLPASLRKPRTDLSNFASPCSSSGTSTIGSIDSPISPLHSFTPGFPFLQILPTVAYLFFFRTDSTDSPDCLPILLSISVFTC